MPLSSTPITARWAGSFSGSGAIVSEGFRTRVTLPLDFQGLGEEATPENLLLGALASCYLITLGIMLDKAGIIYNDLQLEGELVTETGARPTIREVEMRPSIVSEGDPAQLRDLAAKAEKFCLIARAIEGNIRKVVAPLEVHRRANALQSAVS